MKPVPTPDSYLALAVIPHGTNEMLRYVMAQVIERPADGGMSYSSDDDAITYHLMLNETDKEFFPMIQGLTEIWVTTRARRES